jgi:hypothetical protein
MITAPLAQFRPRLAALLLSFLPAVGSAAELAPEFHVRGCEFTPERITYYFEGRIVNTVDARLVPDHGDMSIWLTTIASPLGKTDAVDESRLPVHAVFDYVRYYAKP